MTRTTQDSQTELASNITTFAVNLKTRVLEAASFTTFSLDDESVKTLDRYIDLLPLESSHVSASSCHGLDSAGTELWNACSRLMSVGDGEWGQETCRLLIRVKVLALLMLESAAANNGIKEGVNPFSAEEGDKDSMGLSDTDRIRLLEVALRTARLCIEIEQFPISLRILEIAAVHVERLHASHIQSGCGIGKYLVQEYYILRIMLYWRQNRLDLVEHMFSKLKEYRTHHNLEAAGNLADACYRIGKWLLSNHDLHAAIIWFERALGSAGDSQMLQHQECDANSTRLVTQQALVRAHLELNTEESRVRITELLASLDEEHGNAISTLMLKLEVIVRGSSFDSSAYYDTLLKTIHTLQPTDKNTEMILYYIHKLRNQSVELSAEAFRQLLVQKTIPTGNRSSIESVFLGLLWSIATSPSHLPNGLDILIDAVTKTNEGWGKPLSATCSHASLILIWKKVDFASSQGNYEEAERWSQFAQHLIFQQCKEVNRAKIKRKLMFCALQNSNVVLARQTANELNQEDKLNPLTLYLMYNLSLREMNMELGASCLRALCELESGRTYILACIMEAQQSGNRQQAVVALKQLLDTLDHNDSKQIHLPALLRCTTRLLASNLEDETHELETPEYLCQIFEKAATQATEEHYSAKVKTFSMTELEWFSRNSYNLALELRRSWPLDYSLRLLNVSVKLVDLYPRDVDPIAQIYARRMLCEFLATAIIVSRAREQTDSSIKEEQYLDVRIYVQGFRNNIQSQLDRKDAPDHEEWLQRYRTMLSFDFEAVIYMNQLESLRTLIDEAGTVADGRLYTIFADAILCSHIPIEIKSQAFEQMIHTITTLRSPYLNTAFYQKLPRYIHCLFELALPPTKATELEPASSLISPTLESSPSSSNTLAESVLDRAYIMARDIRHSHRQDMSYPDDELEWLATMAFNRAVDLYLASADEDSRRWGRKAIELAQLVQYDGGCLSRLLKDRFDKLW
ncbi:hypothetical protein DTO166G4_8087 [Paecilomyces variotii]|nr:hypothetical protein DTO166G4_8087 [Paecilomyces variotii]KAJ9233075.1 hypothetical protein DTO166G5_5872 [Paecilomyces variotii]